MKMIRKILRGAALMLTTALALHAPGAAAQHSYSLNVLNQRTIALTAQYWNPMFGAATTEPSAKIT